MYLRELKRKRRQHAVITVLILINLKVLTFGYLVKMLREEPSVIDIMS